MYLIDTDVLSELRKGERANAGVRAFFRGATGARELMFVSVLTLGEIRRGIDRARARGDEDQAERLENWFQAVAVATAQRTLPVDYDVAQVWGRLSAPDTGNAIDKLIAATALIYDLTVVTRNERDFRGTGVRVFNPWVAQPGN
jgi:toxin FitB